MLNLLTEPVINIVNQDRKQERLAFPEILTALTGDRVKSFPNLQKHQEHAWHALTVQLAALALIKEKRTTPLDSPEQWAQALETLTGSRAAWELVNEDLSQPAFLQPPLTREENGQVKFTARSRTPEGLDIIFRSKNFETKQEIAWEADPDHWLFSIVNLQSGAPHGGNGHYCASKLNGGSSSRTGAGIVPRGGPGRRFLRDLGILARHPDITGDRRTAILWTIPWEGTRKESLNPEELHILYIEAARRARILPGERGRLEGLKTTSETNRIKPSRGVTGDPWTIVQLRESNDVSLRITERGLNHQDLNNMILDQEKWRMPLLATPTPEEIRSGDLDLVIQGLAGGQGKSAGFHEISMPMSKKALEALVNQEVREEAKRISEERRKDANEARKALAAAIEMTLNQGDTDRKSQENRDRARKTARILDRYAGERTAQGLWKELEAAPEEREEIRREWIHGKEGLLPLARMVLEAETAKNNVSVAARTAANARFRHIAGNPRGLGRWPDAPAQRPEPETPARVEIPGELERTAPALAEKIAREAAKRPALAKRLANPEGPENGSQDMERFLEGLPGAEEPETRAKWALIISGMARMTQTNLENARFVSAHRKDVPLGMAMHAGNPGNPSPGTISPAAVNRLMESRGDRFHHEVRSLFRRLGNKGARLDWADTAALIFHQEDDNRRMKVYQDYEKARRRWRDH